MARRGQGKDAAFAEALVGLAGLGGLLWYISPEFRGLVVLAACILLAGGLTWLGLRLIKRKNRAAFERDAEWKKSGDSFESPPHTPTISEQIRKIDWFQFEKLVELIYRQRGYSVQRLGGANADGGVDLLLEKENLKSVVQCKHWRSRQIGVRHIREFLGTLTDSKIPNGIFITLTGYSDEAKQLADKHGIQILKESDVIQMLEGSGLKNSPEVMELFSDSRKFCPKCERQMVLRTARSTGNQFWGCANYPRCKFVLNYES